MRLVLILVAIFLGARAVATDYSAQLITTGSGELVYPTSLNDFGQVAGYSFRSLDDRFRPWVWLGGQIHFLPECASSQNSLALAINNLGQVAGTTIERSRGRTRACVWQADFLTLLPNPVLAESIDQSEAVDINDLGEIVGTAWRIKLVAGNVRYLGQTVVWQNDQVARLSPFFDYLTNSGLAINQMGEVAGTVEDRVTGQMMATCWDRNGTTHPIMCAPVSQATALNERGAIVGSYTWGGERGFYADSTCGLDLGGPTNATSCRPTAINNSNLVVGTLTFAGGLTQPFLWQSQKMEILSLANPDWQLLTANDLNDSGQIVGSAYYQGKQVGYLLTPVPEPASLLGLLLPLPVLGRKRRN